MPDESKIFGVSLRGWIALLIVYTVCMMSVGNHEVREPLYTLCTTVIGFYYGSKVGEQRQKPKNSKDENNVSA